jgi:hypothetical protein
MGKFFALFFAALFALSILGFAGIAMDNPPNWIFAITKFMFSLKD